MLITYLFSNKSIFLKCVIKCKVVSVTYEEDEPCLELVEEKFIAGELEEQNAINRQLAAEENHAHNLGYDYVREELAAGNSVFAQDDIILRTMSYDFPGVSEENYYKE